MKADSIIKVTTLSVHRAMVAKLERLAREKGLSTDQIINYCLSRYAKELKLELNLQQLSVYQPRCKEYRAFPVKLPQKLYEMGFDLRKSLKLSLSFIFALAFAAYLDDLSDERTLSDIENRNYSYNDITYSGRCFSENGTRYFLYSWEKPPS